MWVRVEVRNKYNDHLGDIPSEPISIGEYFSYPLKLVLFSDQSPNDFALQVNGDFLPREGRTFFIGSDHESEKGRRGQIPVRIIYEGKHISTGYIHIIKGNITSTQYDYLLRDLRNLISIAASDKTYVLSSLLDIGTDTFTSFDRRLNAIEEYLNSVKDVLFQIEQSPLRAIKKFYYLEFQEKAKKIDARTIRWQAIHGDQNNGRVKTYSNVESFDLYENQFIVYTLLRLKRYLPEISSNFSHTIDQKIVELQHRIIDLENYEEIGGNTSEITQRKRFKESQTENIKSALTKLRQVKEDRIPYIKKIVNDFMKKIEKILSDTFLANVTRKTNLIIVPSLVLLTDPAYNRLFLDYKKASEILKLDEDEKLENLLRSTPIERTSKLYEYWVFLQVYLELRRMGFYDAKSHDGIWDVVDRKNYKLISGACVHLEADPKIYQNDGTTINARIYYEHRFGPAGNFCPDIFIEFHIGQTVHSLILDAKYRNYDQMGVDSYQRDVDETAFHKYKKLQKKNDDENWTDVEDVESFRQSILASFIIHSHPDEKRFKDYGSAGHSNQFGAIPLVPEEPVYNPTTLKRLLKMFMRMHLNIHNVCWSESHIGPQKAFFIPKGDWYHRDFDGTYHCQMCNNTWWVNYCGNCRKILGEYNTKITFSDPADNFFDFGEADQVMGEKRLLKCSCCNQVYLYSRR